MAHRTLDFGQLHATGEIARSPSRTLHSNPQNEGSEQTRSSSALNDISDSSPSADCAAAVCGKHTPSKRQKTTGSSSGNSNSAGPGTTAALSPLLSREENIKSTKSETAVEVSGQ